MTVHNVGAKAARDRAILLGSYEAMVKEFRPRSRLTASDIAKLTNSQLHQAAEDLYNAQPVKKAQRLARKLGLSPKPKRRRSLFWTRMSLRLVLLKARIASWWGRRTIRKAAPHA